MSNHRKPRNREETMSHDFARSHRMKREASRKKPARRSGGVPSWLWVLIGTLAGGLIMFLVYLSGVAPKLPNLKAAATPPQHAEASDTAKTNITEPSAPPKRTSPVFEFYTKLPEGGSVTDIPAGAQPQNPVAPNAPVTTPSATNPTPAQPDGAATQPPATSPATTTASTPATEPTPPTEALDPIQQLLAQQEAEKQKATKPQTTPAANTQKTAKKADTTKTPSINTTGKLYLQAGVFRNHAEADKLRTKIASLGLKPSMQSMSNSSGETLQKVLVGPFAKKADMDEASIILTGNKINAFPVK